jgi:hypothetical protein
VESPTWTATGGEIDSAGVYLKWSGRVPPQKWMNFYTKVLAKYASDGDLHVTVSVSATPAGGLTPQQIEETKTAPSASTARPCASTRQDRDAEPIGGDAGQSQVIHGPELADHLAGGVDHALASLRTDRSVKIQK